MSENFVPDDRFVERLEWQLASEYRRKKLLRPAGRNITISRRMAAALLVAGFFMTGVTAIKAAEYFSKAALQGMPEAALEYGVLVFRGEGVEKDEALGAKWLLVAANHGNAIAQNRMAKLYATGRGVTADAVEAAKWNILAKAGGRPDQELDDGMAKLDPSIVKQAQARAAAFKPLAIGTQN